MPRRDLGKCGFVPCDSAAEYRGRTIYPDEPVARCAKHTGHHEFTERLVNGMWIPISEDCDSGGEANNG